MGIASIGGPFHLPGKFELLSEDAPDVFARKIVLQKRLFSCCKTTNAGCGQTEFTEPSHRIAQANKALPMQLWNLALGFAFADLAQRIKFIWA
jgi:hypothetical protein